MRLEITRQIRLRGGLALALIFLVFVRPTLGSILMGLPVALAGLAIRAWAAGHIVKEQKLAITGPYAHTRNPLYLGSFLLAAGFALMAHWSMLLLAIVLFGLIYGPTIEQERRQILARFPDEYPEYARNVPVFIPRLTPWRNPLRTGENLFSFELYMRHREWQAALAFVAVVVWLFLRARTGS